MQQNKKPANWTEVHSEVLNGNKYSFYFSDKGAFKATKHSERGEQIVVMTAGVALEDLALLFPSDLSQRLYEAHKAANETFQSNKVRIKEENKLERQKANEINKAERTMQAALDQLNLMAKRIEDLKRVG